MKIWWTKIFFIENKSFNIESDVAFGIIKIEAKAFENSTHEVVYTFTLGFYFFKYPKKKTLLYTRAELPNFWIILENKQKFGSSALVYDSTDFQNEWNHILEQNCQTFEYYLDQVEVVGSRFGPKMYRNTLRNRVFEAKILIFSWPAKPVKACTRNSEGFETNSIPADNNRSPHVLANHSYSNSRNCLG